MRHVSYILSLSLKLRICSLILLLSFEPQALFSLHLLL